MKLLMLIMVLGVGLHANANDTVIKSIAHSESHFGQVTAQLLLAEAGVESYYEAIRLPEPVMDTKSAKISAMESNTITVSTNADIVNIYPNPSDGYINIEYALFTSPVNKFIEIYTLQGSLVERIPIKQNAGFVYYNKVLSAGTYLVKVGDSCTQKVEVK